MSGHIEVQRLADILPEPRFRQQGQPRNPVKRCLRFRPLHARVATQSALATAHAVSLPHTWPAADWAAGYGADLKCFEWRLSGRYVASRWSKALERRCGAGWANPFAY